MIPHTQNPVAVWFRSSTSTKYREWLYEHLEPDEGEEDRWDWWPDDQWPMITFSFRNAEDAAWFKLVFHDDLFIIEDAIRK